MDTQQQKQFKVLLIGDSCLDVYHYGTCERLSPEAPVPVFKLVNTEEKAGMVLNVSNNLSSFALETETLTNTNSKITKERFIDIKSMNHLLRLDTGEAQPIESIDLDLVTEEILKQYDVVGIVDYNKGFIRADAALEIARRCKQVNVPLFVDSKKKDLNIFENAVIKINELEFETAHNFPKECELIITHGNKGAVYNNKLYKTQPVEVHDVCGAGDTFFAALIYQYLLTKDLPSSIEFANKCARITVTKTGVYSLSKEDIKNVNLC